MTNSLEAGNAERLIVGGWSETDKQDNALATAARAAETGKAHYLYGYSASYEQTGQGLLQVKDGETVIAEHFVENHVAVEFAVPVKITAGTAVSAELAASGSAGKSGAVNIHGVTR